MPPPPPRRLRLALAVVGYLLTWCACLIGMTGVLVTWLLWIVVDLAYGAWTGTFRSRLRRSRR